MSPGEKLRLKLPEKKIEEWIQAYDEIYLVEGEEYALICRYLTIAEYNHISARWGTVPIFAEDEIFKLCVIYPKTDVDVVNAGVVSTVANAIMARSGFGEDQTYITEQSAFEDEQMESFQNQIPCIIAEAFPKFNIEEIESWSTPKLLRYLSKAKFVLSTYRDVVFGEAKEISSEGNPSDFQEHREEEAFLSGKMQF